MERHGFRARILRKEARCATRSALLTTCALPLAAYKTCGNPNTPDCRFTETVGRTTNAPRSQTGFMSGRADGVGTNPA